MQVGRMNNPENDLVEEVRWTKAHGFHFIDLTVEPPMATLQHVHSSGIKDVLRELELGIIGHAPYYVPIQSPLRSVREACLSEFIRLLEAFKELGADRMAVHFNRPPPLLSRDEVVTNYIEVLTPLCDRAEKIGMTIILENTFGVSNQIDYFGKVLGEVPKLMLLLDVAHANLERQWDAAFIYMKTFHRRLAHVHLSENDGSADQHLPFGVVPRRTLDWPKIVRNLKKHGYDGSITLEIFSPNRDYLLKSRDLLLGWWNA